MADYVSPVIEVVKLVGPSIWKYIKFQITPNSYVKEYGIGKGWLQNRLHDIETEMQSQQKGIGKIPKKEVEDWLKRARDAISDTYEDGQFKTGGCFCNICRTKHLYQRTQELKSIHEEGETYIQAGVILVQDDHAVIKDHLMGEFRRTQESLQLRKKDIESTLQEQIHFGKIVKEEVNGWLNNAKKKLETAQNEVSKGESLSPTFLLELLSGKIRELNEVLEKGENYIHAGVILVKDDPSTMRGNPLYVGKCYGSDTALAEIPKYLKGDQVRRIAVWGMGGVGKTTLMKEIRNQFLNEAQFDKVIWITVSSKLDVRRIQDEIALLVDKEKLEEDDATRRAGKMLARLRRGNYLLILDDVWEAFSDEDVGIPAEFGGLKLVLTTRAADVARRMDCDVIIKLEPLSFKEALQLFLDKVGKVVQSDDGNIKPGLESILMQIVEECHGLPLAVATIATTMKGVSNHQHSWLKALKQLQKGKSVVKGEKDPIRMLKFSYDYLEDKKVQLCFLYCALFPEDFKIPKEMLIELWIEEGFIDQMDTRHEMISEGHVILRKLEDNCLLESISECDEVKMHDLLRDMALDITSKSPRFFVKARVREEELHKGEAWPTNVEKVSLMDYDYRMKEIPLPPTLLKYNMLTTLLMSRNSIITIPESFFMHTPSLRILDLSWNSELRSLPDSISDLEKLTTLLLGSCYKLKKVPSLSKCQALTKLDLGQSGVEEVPDGIEMLVNLKYLDLKRTWMKVPEGMLLKLSNLQHLLIEFTNLRVEDLVTLRKLEYLEAVNIKGERDLSIPLMFVYESVERLTLKLEGICTDLLLNDSKWVCHLSNVGGWDENHGVKCVNRILVDQMLSLRSLNIQSSKDIECVFGLGFNLLQTLEDLRLVRLSSLKYVFDEKALGLPVHSSLSYCLFPLKSIVIRYCDKLKMLFSPALLRGYLQNLESISVSYCWELEEIIPFTFEREEAQIEEKLTLPKLKMLKLKDLPNLKSICNSSSVLVCDSLELLKIRRCQELNRIPLYFPQLDNNAQSSSPLSLRKIKVDSEKWMSFSTEWCHPKDMLLPFCKMKQRLPEAAPPGGGL